MIKIFFRILFALAISFMTMQCAKGTNGISLAGKYADRLTMQHDISDKYWNLSYPGTGSCERQVLNFDRNAGFATYVEGVTNCPNPGKYGKVFFESESADLHWFCTFLSGKATASEVEEDAERPQSVSPSLGGCNGSAWGKLTPIDANLTLNGDFTDNWSSTHKFTNTLWTTSGCTYAIIFYDTTNGFFLYQQQGDASCYAANNYKFGKVFWAVSSANKLYYCQLLYDKASYLTVANDTSKPGYTNPASSGCGGFSWTQLIR